MKKIIYIDLDNTLADYLDMANALRINPSNAKHIPVISETLYQWKMLLIPIIF